MTLNEAFKEAVEGSSISNLELSWSMHISIARLEEILNGAPYVPGEELEILRFVLKHKHKIEIELSKNGAALTSPLGTLTPGN